MLLGGKGGINWVEGPGKLKRGGITLPFAKLCDEFEEKKIISATIIL